jgi:hypothetical protein
MLTNTTFWIGILAGFLLMFVWHKYQAKKSGS